MTSNSVSNRPDDIATELKSCLLSTLGTHLSTEPSMATQTSSTLVSIR